MQSRLKKRQLRAVSAQSTAINNSTFNGIAYDGILSTATLQGIRPVDITCAGITAMHIVYF